MDLLDPVIDFMRDYGLVALFVLMAIDNLNFPLLPSEPVLLYGGYLVARGDFPAPAVVASLLAGTMTGALLSYAIGRYGGRVYFERHGRWLGVTPRKLQAADDWFERYGDRAVFFGRMVPLLRTFISLPAGVAIMPIRHFFVFTLLGAAAWTTIVGGAGYVLSRRVSNFEALLHRAEPVLDPLKYGLLGVALVVTAMLMLRYRRRRRARQ